MDKQTSTSKDVVLQAWKAFGSRDPARIADVFTADAEWLAPPDNATARALDGMHHLIGRERIVRFLAVEFPAVFAADVTVGFRAVIAEGDTVVVEERMCATLANGRFYDNDYCFVFEVQDGRIRRVREYMDTQRGAKMFGIEVT
ncbi:nuclear transport factor 2 family protein [Pseudonocardia nigra]|uniref:nuclear transport factor 2 family protein n=1 Tax=Pseudonocardia nigra TaxID=1921578 RepID=UPI001C5DFE16|nr:nuclear transport factor 2 family protein [Pseudonocardia nigra]